MNIKVNRPPQLELVRGSQNLENDPGASSGSGLSYDGPPKDQKNEDPENEQSGKKPKLRVVSELEKGGMTEVVTEFYEHKNPEGQAQNPGLSARYQVDQSKTKGLLLNKKAE